MSTTSEVKGGLDEIAAIISSQRAIIDKAKANAGIVSANLAAITTDYADVISTIDGYVGSDVFETLAQDEKTKLVAEFAALKAEADAIVAV